MDFFIADSCAWQARLHCQAQYTAISLGCQAPRLMELRDTGELVLQVHPAWCLRSLWGCSLGLWARCRRRLGFYGCRKLGFYGCRLLAQERIQVLCLDGIGGAEQPAAQPASL